MSKHWSEMRTGKIEAASIFVMPPDGNFPKAENFITSFFNSFQILLETKFLTKAVELAKKLELPNHLSYAYVNLGNYYWQMKNQPAKALPFHLKGLALAQQTNDYFQKTEVTTDLGSLYDDLGMPDSAFYYSQKGLALARQQGMDEQIQEALDYIASYQATKGNFKIAYEASRENRIIADSLYDKGLADAMADADARYETSKKEAQLAEQELQISQQQNRQNQIIIAALALLAIAAALFQYFFYRQKRKKQAAELALQAEQVEAERLRELDQLKSAFFTNISHELRTPLTLVAAPLEDALETAKPGPLQSHLQLAKNNTQKLLTLVNEILDLSKLEAGKIGTRLSTIDLNSFCRRVFYSFESIAQLRNIELDFHSDAPDGTQLQSDTEKLEKILNNLLSNAIKFTDTGGRIRFAVLRNEAEYQLSVSDTGKGIPAAELPKIFDRFYQATGNGNPLQGGSGIGLALAKELSQLLGGDLQAESELGKGSRFSLTLPSTASGDLAPVPQVDESDKADEKYTRHYAPLLLNGEKPRLLIVEDNPEMSSYLANSLAADYQCTVAHNGEVALQKLAQHSFDLITSDVMMPQMDGFTFREKVNENEAWRQIPFIMLTARSLEEDKLRGFQLGVDDYLTKPFNRRELEARIHNLLQNKISRDSYEEAEEEETSVSVDQQLIQEAEAFVLKNLDNPKLRVDDLASELNYSSRQLGRVFRKITGLTPVNFILELRLQRGRQLLESRRFRSVAEVRYEVGIESASYFTTKFTERFGKNPREYLS